MWSKTAIIAESFEVIQKWPFEIKPTMACKQPFSDKANRFCAKEIYKQNYYMSDLYEALLS